MATTIHHVTVDGGTYEFMMVACSDGTYWVEAPGAVRFSVLSLPEARETLRGLYAKKILEDDNDG